MSEKYKKHLLKIASSFDAITESCGEITNLVTSIVEDKNDKSIIVLMNKISSVLDEKKDSSTIKIAKELHDSLLSYYGYLKIQEIQNSEKDKEDTRIFFIFFGILDFLNF